MSQTETTHTKDELLARLVAFLDEIKDMTAGTGLEQWLQAKQGVGSALYSELSRLITLGIEQGWAADTEIAGPRYRRSRLIAPCTETFFLSGTSVLMDSTGNPQNNPEGSFRGDYHLHPYGEINMVVPLNEGAALVRGRAVGLRERSGGLSVSTNHCFPSSLQREYVGSLRNAQRVLSIANGI